MYWSFGPWMPVANYLTIWILFFHLFVCWFFLMMFLVIRNNDFQWIRQITPKIRFRRKVWISLFHIQFSPMELLNVINNVIRDHREQERGGESDYIVKLNISSYLSCWGWCFRKITGALDTTCSGTSFASSGWNSCYGNQRALRF